MSRVKMVICMLLVMLGFGIISCDYSDCVTYCQAGTIVGNTCTLVTVCDVCAYDYYCCYGFDYPDCGLEPYPW